MSEASVKRWCDKGVLPAARTAGGHRRLPVGEVVRFIRETGRPLAEPALLGLPTRGRARGMTIERALEHAIRAAEEGDATQFRSIAVDLYVAGHSVYDICDKVIAPVFTALGSRWQHGAIEVYQERLACEICMRTLYDLRTLLPTVPVDAPYAIGGTLEDNPYALATFMIELVLREIGWHAESYGVGHPAETLCAAVERRKPKLVWVSFTCIDMTPIRRERWQALYETASAQNAALVVGGRALTEESRRQMAYSVFCDTLADLVAFARTLHPVTASPLSNVPKP